MSNLLQRNARQVESQTVCQIKQQRIFSFAVLLLSSSVLVHLWPIRNRKSFQSKLSPQSCRLYKQRKYSCKGVKLLVRIGVGLKVISTSISVTLHTPLSLKVCQNSLMAPRICLIHSMMFFCLSGCSLSTDRSKQILSQFMLVPCLMFHLHMEQIHGHKPCALFILELSKMNIIYRNVSLPPK